MHGYKKRQGYFRVCLKKKIIKVKKKILITGGTGFIGTHLAKKCIKLDWKVTCIHQKQLVKKKILGVKYIRCDLSNKKNLEKKIKERFDYIVNLAGYVDHSNKVKTYQTHFIGCKNVADFFLNKKILKFLQMGSCLEYGSLKSPHQEDLFTNLNKMKSFYSKSKLLATNYLLKLNRNKNFPSCILRLYLAYGPGQDTNRFIPITINACLKNKNFDTSNGIQKRDFLFIDDLISLIIKALLSKFSSGKIFNAGSGNPQVLKSITNRIIKESGGGFANYGKIKLRKDEVLNVYPSIVKAKKILRWEPKINFIVGLKKTIKHYRNGLCQS